MKGKIQDDNWVLFEDTGADYLRVSQMPRHFFRNNKQDFQIVEYNSSSTSLNTTNINLEHDDNSRLAFNTIKWEVDFEPNKRIIIGSGRAFAVWDLNKLPVPKYEQLDICLNSTADWLYVSKDRSYALKPFETAFDDEKDDLANFGKQRPGMVFRYDLLNYTHSIFNVNRYQDTWLGPEFILQRFYLEDEQTTDRWTALDFNLKEIDPPLVKLLNSIRDSVGHISTFEIGSKGFSFFSKDANNIATQLFLVATENELKVYPLYCNGTEPMLTGQGSQTITIAPDGQHFLISVHRDSPREVEDETLWDAVYIGKVEWVNGKPIPKLKFLKDFPSLLSSNPFVWFSDSDGFVVANDKFSGKPRLWIYDLNKTPIDWSTVPIALEKK